jgi:hypothetical protein
MQRSILLALILATMLLPAAASAQRSFAGLTYNYSFPAVDLDGFVGQDSWYGITLDMRRALTSNPKWLVGLTTGWYVFYNNVNTTIDLGNGAISGEQYRNFNIVPVLASINYMMGDRRTTHPYIGFHIGAYYARQQLDLGLYSLDESNWHFGLAPEGGIVFPLHQYNSSFYFNVRYHYLYEAGGYLGDQALTLPFLTLGAGFAWEY